MYDSLKFQFISEINKIFYILGAFVVITFLQLVGRTSVRAGLLFDLCMKNDEKWGITW